MKYVAKFRIVLVIYPLFFSNLYVASLEDRRTGNDLHLCESFSIQIIELITCRCL